MENLHWFGYPVLSNSLNHRTVLVSGIKLKVKGKGPANLLASFQSEKGEPSGSSIFPSSLVSMAILKPELAELIFKVPFCIIWFISVVVY